jgi:hypothetical protein
MSSCHIRSGCLHFLACSLFSFVQRHRVGSVELNVSRLNTTHADCFPSRFVFFSDDKNEVLKAPVVRWASGSEIRC